jgi:hypothetical protein
MRSWRSRIRRNPIFLFTPRLACCTGTINAALQHWYKTDWKSKWIFKCFHEKRTRIWMKIWGKRYLGLAKCWDEATGVDLSSEREGPSVVARLLWPLTGEEGRLLALLHCGLHSVGEDTLHQAKHQSVFRVRIFVTWCGSGSRLLSECRSSFENKCGSTNPAETLKQIFGFQTQVRRYRYPVPGNF